ncbi:MAG: aminodeoxychorismate synthase component I [Myxococcota bacterium]
MESTSYTACLQTACAVRALSTNSSIVEAAAALRIDSHFWWLDSALASENLGRFSFVGADPYLVVRARGSVTELQCLRAVHAGLEVGTQRLSGDPLEVVGSFLPPAPASVDTGLPFIGGAVGYLGYELAAQFERHEFSGLDDLGLPDLYLLFVDSLIAHDAVDGKLYACALGFAEDFDSAMEAAERACDGVVQRAHRERPEVASVDPVCTDAREPFAFFDECSYAKAVTAAKQEIEAGEVYQTCLTFRSERGCPAQPWELYLRLRCVNPAPFASYFELPEVSILSSSPERFLKLNEVRRVESRPIKGTRPRASTESADRAIRAELAASEKDRAENLMIVDLVRNDLGRVCEVGSVEVPELMAIETYASVHQMLSTVTGLLRSDRNALDLVRATFPPGSMTGAPKIAAMRILDGLEPVRRGIYSGAIGYFDARGGMDLSVVIRTILAQRGRAYVHSGGGIVADSDPVEEWAEACDKARLLEAVLDEFSRSHRPDA